MPGPEWVCSCCKGPAKPDADGEGEAGGVGADAGDCNGGVLGAGDQELDRHDPGKDVDGWRQPGWPVLGRCSAGAMVGGGGGGSKKLIGEC